tara:strand:- start:12053 stop:14353 length:2301 start_codon:yes stop_codon:yes gene_type:complete
MASKAIGFLNFKFGADLKPFERAMNKAQKKLKRFGKSIQKTGKSLTTSLTLPIAALGVASVKAFDKQQKAIAQVEAGLKSTAGTVGFTSKELQKMAADLQKTTLFGDEEILQGATAQLLTFTNITGTQFEKTQKIALDLATRLDGDLKSASIMLGKALNDPIANLSALSRAGIQFSDDQKSVVKSLVETGQLAEAQTIILEELEKQYGGSAAAAAEAGLGPIQQLKNQLSDLSEQIGERLLPFVKQFVDWLVKMAEKFDGLSESTKDNIVKWGLLLAALGPTLIMIGKIATGISALIPIIRALTVAINSNPWMLLVAAIVAAGFALAEYAMEATALEQSQKSLNEIQLDAIANAKNQERILLKQLEIARDVTKSDDLRKKAIGELNKTLGSAVERLNLKNIAEVNVTNAINEHTAAMIKQAKIAGVKNLISENFEEMTKLAQDGTRALKGFWTISGQLQRKKLEIGGLIDLVKGDKNRAMGKQITEQIINGAQSELQNNQDFLENLLNDLVGDDESLIAQTITPTITPLGDGDGDGDDGDGSKVEKKVKSIEALSLATNQLNTEFQKLETIDMDGIFDDGSVSRFVETFGILGDEMAIFLGTTVEELGEAMDSVMGRIEGNLSAGANSFEDYGQTIKAVAKEEIGALISTGVAAAVSNAMKGMASFPGSVFLIPVIAAAAAGLARTAFNSLIPAFAEGGMVTGPTTALIGEGIGTSASNPEVVAPLDKLKSMIGGGTQNIVVEGRLAGNDIFLSNARTKFNRNRTV